MTIALQKVIRTFSATAVLILTLALGPSTTLGQSAAATYADEGEPPADVVEVLHTRGRYSALVNALKRTGIDQGLRISPSYTLFAPTDSAFAALDARMSSLSNETVAEILRNHVIQKALSTDELGAYTEIQNARGLLLDVGPGGATIGQGRLVEPNLTIKNGFVHGIDVVILREIPVDVFR